MPEVNGEKMSYTEAVREVSELLGDIKTDTVTLRDHLETQLRALDRATTLAKENMELRLEGMNEWRAQSKDREATYATKDMFAALEVQLADRFKDITDDIRELEKTKAELAGKASATATNLALGMSLLGMAITLYLLFTGG